MKGIKLLQWLWVASPLTVASAVQGQSVTVGYAQCMAVPNYSQSIMNQIGQLRWYFAHASVGECIMEGVTNLHLSNSSFYQLQGFSASSSPPASTQAGAITSLGRARGVVRGTISLVGDASGTVDGIAGQGLSLAFQQAQALGEALGCGDLSHYESAHRRIMQNAARMTRLLLLMSASAAIRRKAMRLFAAHPAVFSNLISVHAGQAAPDALGAAEILDLGWRVLCA